MSDSYRDSLGWLYGLQLYGIKLGLEAMRRLCDALHTETVGGGGRKFLHVAGTNGKGSVCAMLAAMLCAERKRTGLYTSPHLVSFRERIRLGANLIPEAHVVEGLERIRQQTAAWEHSPTFFEVATALALDWFQRQRAEWAVIETGLGGRLDATNIITPAVSVITPIGMDHTRHLGGTLAEIAREKAGIIKPGVPVVSSPQAPEAEAVLREVAAERGSAIHFVTTPIAMPVALAGPHQRMNAAVAFATLVTAGLRPSPGNVAAALRTVKWPGRFQLAGNGRIVLDGAHNPPAAEQLAATWSAEFPGERATLILGALGDKDVRGVCAPLLPLAARVICVPVRNPRSLAADVLAAIVRDLGCASCETAATLPAALERASHFPERTLVAGSLFLVGEALAHLGLVEGAQEWSAQ